MKVGDLVVEEIRDLREDVVGFFTTFYIEPFSWQWNLNDLDFDALDQWKVQWLERPFREEEILEALRNCKKDKALWLDGFNMAFLQNNWETME